MDANQTRFHLLLGEDDWTSCTGRDGIPLFDTEGSRVVWDGERKEVKLRPRLLHFVAAPGDTKPRLGDPRSSPPGSDSDRRGAARDRYGNWYFISPDQTKIRVHSVGCNETSDFWATTDANPQAPSSTDLFQPSEPLPVWEPHALRGLTVTEDHFLVVGMIEPAGLLVFDLHAGGPPRPLLWPEAIPFEPFDMAPRPDGGVWILDRTNRRYWALGRHFCVSVEEQIEQIVTEPTIDVFQSVDGCQTRGRPSRSFPTGIWFEQASPIAALDPIAIEALSDGTVLILDANPGGPSCQVLRYRFSRLLGDSATPEALARLIEQNSRGAFHLRAFDFAFVPQADANDATTLGRLYIASENGNQVFSFILHLRDDQLWLAVPAEPEFLPMRLFSGMGLVAADGRVYYDSSGRWLPLIAQPRIRHEVEAIIRTREFDAREPQSVWHRLLLDACLPPETEVEIQSRVADEKSDLAGAPWMREPRLYRRGDGSEIPFVPKPGSADRGTFELLFQKAKGRFLQLELRLRGNGRLTPRLRALRIYYPRFSYLKEYLPAVYREEAVPASFLDRFLANLEGLNTALEDKIAAVQILFDVRSAPQATLGWLASWFGVALDPAWDEQRRRLFIAHAMEFFQWRGTAHGLRMALRMIFEPEPDAHIFDPPGGLCRCGDRFRIVEQFLTRRTPGVVFGDPTDEAGLRRINTRGRWTPQMGVAELRRRFSAVAAGRSWAAFDLDGPSVAQAAARAEEMAARLSFAQRELGFEPSDVTEDLVAWRNYLRVSYPLFTEFERENPGNWTNLEEVPLPATQPASVRLRKDWRAYQEATASQPFGVKRRLWQEFLQRKYRSIHELNRGHHTGWDSFKTVAYPASLPMQSVLLEDWYQFESVVLPTLAAAHRFTVLLPVTGDTAPSEERRRELLQLAQRIIDLEKPAHTSFDVKFYFALFRIGEARLGLDSLLGPSGRSLLYPFTVLNQSYLVESRLATRHIGSADGRQIIGQMNL